MSGASAWTTFRRVTLGLMLPVTTSAFILSFIRGVESFESALIFGTPAGIEVITTEIYHLIHHTNRPDYPQATALALGIMVLMFGLVAWQWRLLGGPELLHRHGQGLHAARDPARPLALGHVRLLRPLLRGHRGPARRPARDRLLLQVLRLLSDEHADARALPRRLAEPAGLAGARQHAAARLPRRDGHHGPRRADRLRPRAHALPHPPRARDPGVAAVDDAGHGARRRAPLGVRAHARAHPALRHAVGAARRLRHAGHTARGADDVGRLLPARQ